MAQGADDFDDDDDDAGRFSDAEVARVVLELDRAITRRRRAGAMAHIVEGRPVPLPVKPSRIELAVLTALAQTYGPAVLQHADFDAGARRASRNAVPWCWCSAALVGRAAG